MPAWPWYDTEVVTAAQAQYPRPAVLGGSRQRSSAHAQAQTVSRLLLGFLLLQTVLFPLPCMISAVHWMGITPEERTELINRVPVLCWAQTSWRPVVKPRSHAVQIRLSCLQGLSCLQQCFSRLVSEPWLFSGSAGSLRDLLCVSCPCVTVSWKAPWSLHRYEESCACVYKEREAIRAAGDYSLLLILSMECLGVTQVKQKGMWLGAAPSPVPVWAPLCPDPAWRSVHASSRDWDSLLLLH